MIGRLFLCAAILICIVTLLRCGCKQRQRQNAVDVRRTGMPMLLLFMADDLSKWAERHAGRYPQSAREFADALPDAEVVGRRREDAYVYAFPRDDNERRLILFSPVYDGEFLARGFEGQEVRGMRGPHRFVIDRKRELLCLPFAATQEDVSHAPFTVRFVLAGRGTSGRQ